MSSPAVRPARLPLIIAGAVLLALFAAIFALRQKIVYQLLGDDFRTSVGGEGNWEEPRARQVGRMLLACQDRGGSLRLLHWAGIDGDRSVDDAALGCAATVHSM